MNVLHLDSSATGDASISRELSAAVVQALRQADPSLRVAYRDLVAQPPAHLDGKLLQSLRPQPGAEPATDAAFLKETAYTDELLGEFLAADVVVVAAPMYNFSIPSQLKAWIDRVAQAGKTFRYTANGPEGLAGNKRVIIVSSRGGKYAGTAIETMLDHQESFLRAVFGFFGITDIGVVRAEGVALGEQARAQAIEQALAQASLLAEELKAAA
ncbi:FMN-dependent NADH-azoreductase 1 [Pigmentiphaga humi]|uniref:FMN dependent NADH:quinone oxidoreductase n=1 Tax=Pigmentiphaga humi TaxID=2478468 RepID=A0A3P4B3Q2_9BURK|nr:NAD(P)H-dependent oxidoreductase [Pigmentiphaga humi]VCU70258.1 FMN-dependent NADH-azoreductase 1 [Pigmentiphaga humi]